VQRRSGTGNCGGSRGDLPWTAVRVVLAERTTMFSEAVRSVLERSGEFEVAQAESLDELLTVAQETAAAVALVDLGLPPRGGIEAVAALTDRSSTCAILWSSDPAPGTVVEAIRANACGFLPREVAPAILLETVRAASRGETTAPPVSSPAITRELQRATRRRNARGRIAVLTEREREVLALVARGYANSQVAGSLFISRATVKRHMHAILGKLGVPSRRDAATLYEDAYGSVRAIDARAPAARSSTSHAGPGDGRRMHFPTPGELALRRRQTGSSC
jgi:DNA-binding NarL/FixJ family response regulator